MNTSPDFDAQLIIETAAKVDGLDKKLDGLSVLFSERLAAHEATHKAAASNRGEFRANIAILISMLTLVWGVYRAAH